MQDRYAGDVGDFGKYGLLRVLSGEDPALRLGVVWYLTDETIVSADPVNDGKHIAYALTGAGRPFRDCDPALYDAMAQLLKRGERSVAKVEELGVLPRTTVTYATHLSTPLRQTPREQRIADRERWLDGALTATASCDIVFLDPDNGIETPSVPLRSLRAPKYAYLSELARFPEKQTLMVYHHLGRRPHIEEIATRVRQCRELLGRDVIALRYRRGTSRAFIIAPAERHRSTIESRVAAMLDGPWARHFDRVTAD